MTTLVVDGTERRRLLEALAEETVSEIRKLRELTYRNLSYGHDPADVAFGCGERAYNLTALKQAQRKLRQVNRALARLEAGFDGICEGCDKAIDPARLEVQPHATLCIQCQQYRDKGGLCGIVLSRASRTEELTQLTI